MSSPTASASSRSEVIGVRRSCETAAIRSRRAVSARASLPIVVFTARASSASSSALPVTAAGVARPLAHRHQRVAQRLDVLHRVGREQLRRAHRHHAREHDDDHQQQRVVGGDEHELRRHGREHDELADGDRDPDRELPAQRAEPRAPAGERVGQPEHGGAERGEPEPHERAVAEPVGDRDHPRQRGHRDEHERERASGAHGWNR